MSILQKICQRKFLIYVDVAGMQKCLYLLSFSTFATAQLFQMTALNKLQEFAPKAKRNINLHSLQRVFSKNESFQMCFWLASLNGIYPFISPHRPHCPHCSWIRIETQPTITCLLGGNAIVCCGSTSEGILKLKQHSESTSHFWLSGSIILPPGAWEPKIHIICHIDVLSGFHGQKWQPNKATGPHEFFHRRELLQYLDYQGYRCQGLSL